MSIVYICNCPNTSQYLRGATPASQAMLTWLGENLYGRDMNNTVQETIRRDRPCAASVSKPYLCGVIGTDRQHNWSSVLRSPGSTFRLVAFRFRSNTGRLAARACDVQDHISLLRSPHTAYQFHFYRRITFKLFHKSPNDLLRFLTSIIHLRCHKSRVLLRLFIFLRSCFTVVINDSGSGKKYFLVYADVLTSADNSVNFVGRESDAAITKHAEELEKGA